MNQHEHISSGSARETCEGESLRHDSAQALDSGRASEALVWALSGADWSASHADPEGLIEAADLIVAAGERVRVDAYNTAATRGVRVVGSAADAPDPVTAGCYLVTPPLVGIDAASLGGVGRRSGEAVIAIAREPLNKAGLRPVVAVGRVIIRVRIKDAPDPGSPGVDWFLGACERLSEAALESTVGVEPAMHRAQDLLDVLSAVPHDEESARRLAIAAREAASQPVPTTPRRRAVLDDPTSF